MPAPMTIRASVALKLAGAMQLIQVPMIAGAWYMCDLSLKISYTTQMVRNTPLSILYLSGVTATPTARMQ
jgi:hypothetical protein